MIASVTAAAGFQMLRQFEEQRRAMQREQMPDEIPGRLQRARWHWSGSDWHEIGNLECMLPERNMHPKLHVRAHIEDCDCGFGLWRVYENGELVACGEITSGDKLWRNGEGPQLEAERVICFGPTPDDRARARAYLSTMPQGSDAP